MGERQTNVLVVDDEPKIRRLLRNCFESDGYGVLEAENSAEVDKCLAENKVDLITLDLNLGPENGLETASSIKSKSDIPIIIVTGKGDVIDKVVGLEMGADDYISKPFHIREVIARVRSVLRRTRKTAQAPAATVNAPSPDGGHSENSRFQFDDWIADFSTFELTSPCGGETEMTTADFRLLNILVRNPKRVLSREQIMDRLNGNDWSPYDRSIDNQIARLRKKLEKDPAKPQLIKTVRGVGYTFAADVNQL